MDKAYSTNDEEFPYYDAAEALQALADDDRLVEGAAYYEIDTEVVSLPSYLEADRILELAEEQLYEEIGECAEGAFSATKEAMAELDTLLAVWVEKHISGTYWRCVGKSREIKVTAADVAEYGP